ncbi:MAG: hypothetical protein IPO62_11085 [Saprospiraceae bacterium]|nr:hypothetical protein [Saprospiraceae bacterium]
MNIRKFAFLSVFFCAAMSLNAQALWNIKAINSSGKMIPVKAVGPDASLYDVKADPGSGSTQFMNVVMIKDGKKHAIKIFKQLNDKNQFELWAIDPKLGLLSIKAVSSENQGFKLVGKEIESKVIPIKAISESKEIWNIKAISPEGILHDVKGIKFKDDQTEGKNNGFDFYAHVKAIPQIVCDQNDKIWHVKGLHSEGRVWDIKAFGPNDEIWDVKALAHDHNQHLLDIRAIRGNRSLPIKILSSKEKYARIKAILEDGSLLDVKAIAENGDRLDVKGVIREGNIVHIKVVDKDGKLYGIKAISTSGNFYDVKGISTGENDMVNGVSVKAHVKALPQTN